MSAELTPGRSRCCPGCEHWLPALHAGGHPEPCAAIAWRHDHRVVPALSVQDGVVVCSEFSAAGEALVGEGE